MTRPGIRRTRGAVVALLFACAASVASCSLEGAAEVLGIQEECQRIALDATLHVDATDERWIWGTQDGIGPDLALRIPGGYGVDPGPPGTIVDPNGKVIARDGDLIISGCRSAAGPVHIDEGDVRRIIP